MLFRGAPLWRIQLDLLRKLQPAKVLVSAQTDPPWRPAGVDFVPDNEPSRGPLSGIAAALSRIASTHLLTLAIDMPFMSESYLRRLCELAEAGSGAVPIIRDHAEPLTAIYPQAARDEMVRALSGDNFSLQSVVRELIAADKLQAVAVSKTQQALFRNLNEPDDLKC